jgi:hypothetical protein
LTRKPLRERIAEIQQDFIEGVLKSPDSYNYHLGHLKEALRDLRLRERDVTYHTRDAEAKLAGERTKRGLE